MTLLFMFIVYLPIIGIGVGLGVVLGAGGQQGNEGMIIGSAFAILGLLMLAGLTIWPIFYMIADTELGFEVFGKGFSVGLKNCLIVIPIFFVAMLASMLGVIACGIGVIATMPAGQAMIATAYLNMTGQLNPK